MIPKYVSYSIDPLYELELRLLTMLAGLHTQTGLHSLIIQVLNIKSLLPRHLIQSFHFCTQ